MNTNILEVNDLVKVYKSPKGGQECKALNGVNFEIKEGEFVAIMGESGSGKSTLLNMLAALDAPTSGNINLDGKNLIGFFFIITWFDRVFNDFTRIFDFALSANPEIL